MNKVEKKGRIKGNIDLSDEDFLQARYSPEVIEKAKEYKNTELRYLKELIGDPTDRIHKGDHYRPYKDESINQQI